MKFDSLLTREEFDALRRGRHKAQHEAQFGLLFADSQSESVLPRVPNAERALPLVPKAAPPRPGMWYPAEPSSKRGEGRTAVECHLTANTPTSDKQEMHLPLTRKAPPAKRPNVWRDASMSFEPVLRSRIEAVPPSWGTPRQRVERGRPESGERPSQACWARKHHRLLQLPRR